MIVPGRQTVLENYLQIVKDFDQIHQNFNQSYQSLDAQIDNILHCFNYEQLNSLDISFFTKKLETLTTCQYELIKIVKQVNARDRHVSNRSHTSENLSVFESENLGVEENSESNLVTSNTFLSPCLPCHTFHEINTTISKNIIKITDKVKNLKIKIEDNQIIYEQIKLNTNQAVISYKNLPNFSNLEYHLQMSTTLAELYDLKDQVEQIIDQWTPIHESNKIILENLKQLYPNQVSEITCFMLEKNSTHPTPLNSNSDLEKIGTKPDINFKQEGLKKFPTNLSEILTKIKNIDNYGDNIFNIMHLVRDKLDDAEDIQAILSEVEAETAGVGENLENTDQDLIETKTKLKSLLRNNLLVAKINEKIKLVEDKILEAAKQHAESERCKFYQHEINMWIKSVNDSLEITEITSEVKLLKILEKQYEKIVETTKEKETSVLQEFLKMQGAESQNLSAELHPNDDEIAATQKLLNDWNFMKTQVEIKQNDILLALKSTDQFTNILNKWQSWLAAVKNAASNQVQDTRFKIVKEVEFDNLYLQIIKNYPTDQKILQELKISVQKCIEPTFEIANWSDWVDVQQEISVYVGDFEKFYSLKQEIDFCMKQLILARKNLAQNDKNEINKFIEFVDESDEFFEHQSNDSEVNNRNADLQELDIQAVTEILQKYDQMKQENYLLHFETPTFISLVNFYMKNLSKKLENYQNKIEMDNLQEEFDEKLLIFKTILSDDSIVDLDLIEAEFAELAGNKIPAEVTVKMKTKIQRIQEQQILNDKISNLEEILQQDLKVLDLNNQQVLELVSDVELDLEKVQQQLEILEQIKGNFGKFFSQIV